MAGVAASGDGAKAASVQAFRPAALAVVAAMLATSCSSTGFLEGGDWYGLPPEHPDAAPDAGKVCRDSSECSEWCQAPPGSAEGDSVVGTCFGGRDHRFICWQDVKDGIADLAWCE